MASCPRQEELLLEVQRQFKDRLQTCSRSIGVFLYFRISGKQAQEDILAEALLTAWEKYRNGERVENFTGWFLKILSFKVFEHFRREKGGVAEVQEEFKEEARSEVEVGASIDAKMDWETVKKVLSEEEASILWLHHAEKYSYGEIAEQLGKKEEAIRQKANRAKQKVLSRFPELRGLY